MKVDDVNGRQTDLEINAEATNIRPGWVARVNKGTMNRRHLAFVCQWAMNLCVIHFRSSLTSFRRPVLFAMHDNPWEMGDPLREVWKLAESNFQVKVSELRKSRLNWKTDTRQVEIPIPVHIL